MAKIYTKEEQIKREKNRLKRLFKDLEDKKKKIAEGIIDEAAYMRATLVELKSQVDEDGTIDEMDQGKYTILREHPALKAYNAMIPRYHSALKQLTDLLPKEVPKPPMDELGDFINSRED